MYLARQNRQGKPLYYIRESFKTANESFFRSRDLFDLGADPANYLHYPEGYTFYIDQVVEDTLKEKGLKPDDQALEDMFWPFVNPEVRFKLAPFMHKHRNFTQKRLSPEEEALIDDHVHIFDKRRLHYLCYGSIDQTRLYRAPPKLFRPLLYKSRDEIEQFFIREEKVFDTTEYRQYVYTIFNLQRYFSETIARSMPQGLDRNKIDEFFLDDLCRLHKDSDFWTGYDNNGALAEYLQRYVIMFFDYDFDSGTFMNDYIRRFMDGRRSFKFPEPKSSVRMEEADSLFDVPAEKLKKMSKRALTRLYRRKAHELHPDKGGDQDTFIKLTDIYRELCKRKK